MADFPIGQGAALGYQQVSNTGTAGGLTVPAGTKTAVITVSGQAVRFRDDGTAPSASTGFPVATGVAFTYVGNARNLSFISQTGTATIDVLFYGA